MVLVWNDLAGGDAEYCAAIVALNSLLTIALYPPFSLFFIVTLPAQLFGASAVTGGIGRGHASVVSMSA
jgi:ACR3 family arsenite transporter